MVEPVRDDQVRLAGDRRDHACVGGEAGLEREHGLRSLEPSQLLFELFVQAHRPGDRADSPRTCPELPDRIQRRLPETGMVRQAKVVVGRQADDFAAVNGRHRALSRAHDPQGPIKVLAAQLCQFLVEEGQRIFVPRGRHL